MDLDRLDAVARSFASARSRLQLIGTGQCSGRRERWPTCSRQTRKRGSAAVASTATSRPRARAAVGAVSIARSRPRSVGRTSVLPARPPIPAPVAVVTRPLGPVSRTAQRACNVLGDGVFQDGDCCGRGKQCESGACASVQTATLAACDGQCDCDSTCSGFPIRASTQVCGALVPCPPCTGGCAAYGSPSLLASMVQMGLGTTTPARSRARAVQQLSFALRQADSAWDPIRRATRYAPAPDGEHQRERGPAGDRGWWSRHAFSVARCVSLQRRNFDGCIALMHVS